MIIRKYKRDTFKFFFYTFAHFITCENAHGNCYVSLMKSPIKWAYSKRKCLTPVCILMRDFLSDLNIYKHGVSRLIIYNLPNHAFCDGFIFGNNIFVFQRNVGIFHIDRITIIEFSNHRNIKDKNSNKRR